MFSDLVKKLSFASHIFNSNQNLDKKLSFLNLNFDSKEYQSFSLIFSLFSTLLISTILIYLNQNLLFSVLAFLIIFSLISYLPQVLYQKKLDKMEVELPFFLRTFKISLESGNSFEKALEDTTKLSSGLLSFELSKFNGNILDKLYKLCEIDSNLLKRAFSQLIFIYREGQGLDGLNEIAKDALNIHKMQIKEFNSKFAMFGLLFITFSLILPSFFTAYIIAGSSFLDIYLSQLAIILIYSIVFPLICSIILILIILKNPPTIFADKKYSFTEFENTFSHFLGKRSLFLNIWIYLTFVLLLWAAFSFNFFQIFLIIFIMPFVIAIYRDYQTKLKVEKKEEEIVPILFNISLKSENITDAINSASTFNGALNEDFKTIQKQINAGYSLSDSINWSINKNDSFILQRAFSLILYGGSIGSGVSRALKDTAEDIYEIFVLKKERAASLSLQKYTILLGAILAPIIMSMVFSFSISTNLNIEFGVSEIMRNEMISATRLGIKLYFVMYSILASCFISIEEGKNKALIYLLSILFVSNVIFYLFSV